MKHLMIDIEALGLKPGCAIFELGAVVFDLETGVTGAQFLSLIDPDNGFVDAATEQWHRERGTYPMPGTAERVGITTALANFARWYQCLGWEIQTVWSWGATYDFPVLDSRWQEWGPTEELPWKYYQAECARTIWRRAFADLKHDPRPHQALEDCRAAIKDLVAAHRALRGKASSIGASDFPVNLPALPPVPSGFDRWVYRGVNYASPHAIMVTSFDETEDEAWDPPWMFQTKGDPHTHYAEAVIDHHWICECGQCQAAPRPRKGDLRP